MTCCTNDEIFNQFCDFVSFATEIVAIGISWSRHRVSIKCATGKKNGKIKLDNSQK